MSHTLAESRRRLVHGLNYLRQALKGRPGLPDAELRRFFTLVECGTHPLDALQIVLSQGGTEPIADAAPAAPASEEVLRAEDRAEAFALFDKDHDARYVADWLGRGLNEVSEWCGAWRDLQRPAARAA